MWRRTLSTCFLRQVREEPHVGQKNIDVSCEDYAKWKRANETVDEEFNSYRAKAGIVQCPKCKIGGLLFGGCKFIYCRCGTRYCYLCQVQLQERHHYSHFKSDSKGAAGNGPFGNTCKGPNDPDLKDSQRNFVQVRGKAEAAPRRRARAVNAPRRVENIANRVKGRK